MQWNGSYWQLPHKHRPTAPDETGVIAEQLRMFVLKYVRQTNDVTAQKATLMDIITMLASRLSPDSQEQVRHFQTLIREYEAAQLEAFLADAVAHNPLPATKAIVHRVGDYGVGGNM